MKKLLAVALLALLSASAAVADNINFNFIFGAANTVTATSGGLTSGPAPLSFVSDQTTGVFFPIMGKFVNANTGPASSFLATSSLILATFMVGGTNSVVVQDAMGNLLVEGNTNDNSTLLSQLPNGAGSFLASFHVTFVDPAILAMFGLGPGFLPTGSVALTTGGGNFDGTTFTGNIGGGSVTIETTPVPEPVGLGALGMGLLTIAEGLRRWRAARAPRRNSL